MPCHIGPTSEYIPGVSEKKHATCDTLFARTKPIVQDETTSCCFLFLSIVTSHHAFTVKINCKSIDQKNPWTVRSPKNLVTILRNSDYTSLVYVLGHQFPCFRRHDPSPNHGTTFQVVAPVLWINSSYCVCCSLDMRRSCVTWRFIDTSNI